MKRPGKQDRPTSDNILDAATPLFYQYGLKAVSIDEIAAAADVTKRTLYYHFPTKDDLILAYVRNWHKRTTTWLAHHNNGGVTTLLSAFQQLQEEVSHTKFRGCPIVKAVAEISDETHPAMEIARDYKEDRRAWFEGLLRQDKVPQATKLSRQLLTLWEGGMVRALVSGDTKSILVARDAAVALIAANT